jgi:hypothetical protein
MTLKTMLEAMHNITHNMTHAHTLKPSPMKHAGIVHAARVPALVQ